jgi:hypothetical protein
MSERKFGKLTLMFDQPILRDHTRSVTLAPIGLLLITAYGTVDAPVEVNKQKMR